MTSFDARLVARSLTGHMDIRAFDENVRERSAVRFESAVGHDHVRQLFDLPRLEWLFASTRTGPTCR